jgi:Protein of unknown function (DUF3570)
MKPEPPRHAAGRNESSAKSFRPGSFCTGTALAVWLILFPPRVARAEDSVAYKYADYQEMDGRMEIKTQSALYEQDLGTQMHLKVQGTIDAIAGATPNGQPAPAGSDQVVLADLSDRRKAWAANFSYQFTAVNINAGYANSRENDYVSNGWSVNSLFDFNQKNTTLLAGIAGTDDDVEVFYQTPWAKKRSTDAIVGVTQLLDPKTSVSFNLTWGRATGYLNDQYKLVQKSVEVAPGVFLPFTYGENRPQERTKWVALASINHSFAQWHAAIDASYRFYHDTYGISSNTIELSWLQRLGSDFVLIPRLRYYDQGSADFYYYNLDQTPIMPVAGPPNSANPNYSSDYRLSSLRSYSYGIKAVWTIVRRWQLDVEYERYDMRGRDGVTPQSAYPRANILTAGLKFSW